MNTGRKLNAVMAGSLAVLALRPQLLWACAACYGQSDSPLAEGMNWGIFSLMAVVGCVLSGITMFFVHISKKSAVIDRAAAASDELPRKKD